MWKLVPFLVSTCAWAACPEIAGEYNCGTNDQGKERSLVIAQDGNSFKFSGLFTIEAEAGTVDEAEIVGIKILHSVMCNDSPQAVTIAFSIHEPRGGVVMNDTFALRMLDADKLQVHFRSERAKGEIKSTKSITFECDKNN